MRGFFYFSEKTSHLDFNFIFITGIVFSIFASSGTLQAQTQIKNQTYSAVVKPQATEKPFKTQPMPALLQKIRDKYKQAPSLMAVFKQINESAALKTRKESEGVVSILRPGKVRWETQSPDPSIFISDGKTMWFYSPPFDAESNGQLVIRKASDTQSKLATALLSGEFQTGPDLKVAAKGSNRFQLIPRKGTSGDVMTAEIEIDAQKLLISKVILKHKDGNHSEITLSKVIFGKGVTPDMFQFKAPPKTEIVKE